MFSHKITEMKDHTILAVCDESLLGKVLSDEERSFEVSEEFYGGDIIDEEKLVEKASKSTIINAIGNEAVTLLIQKDFFEEDKVLNIEGVSHAQMAKL